jgi:hypothetical protein
MLSENGESSRQACLFPVAVIAVGEFTDYLLEMEAED